MQYVLIWLAALVISAQLASGQDKLGCQGCIEVSTILEKELFRPQQVHADDQELTGPGPGRRMRHKLGEAEIYAALENVCAKYAGGRDRPAQACKSALEPLKDRVEEYIFQNGVEQLRRHLCIEMLGACSMHMLYDSGEL